MARRSLNISIGGRLGNGDIVNAAVHGIPSTVDTVAAADAAAIVTAAIVVAQGTVATAKLSTAAAKTAADSADTAMDTAKTDADATAVAAAAAQSGIVPLTPLTNAIATMKATPNQGNADAVDTLYSTAVTGVHDMILTLDGLINAAKNASDTSAATATTAKAATLAAASSAATADTDTGTAKTDVDALDMTDVDSNLAAHVIDEGMDVVVDYNDVTIPDKNTLRLGLNKILQRVSE